MALTVEQENFLEECLQEFSDRYSVLDPDYKEVFDEEIPNPPVVCPWYSRFRNSFRERNNRYQDNSKSHNNYNRDNSYHRSDRYQDNSNSHNYNRDNSYHRKRQHH